MSLQRLDKLIALNCNVSRKEARQLIKDGAVTVNSRLMLRAEELIDSNSDDVSVKGYDFSLRDHIYIMMHKPRGVISATTDPRKETVIDIVPPGLKRKNMFPCGRLDKDTTGLLIITDDGDMCHRIMSPSHHVKKTYVAELEIPLLESDMEKLRNGITLSDGTECLPAEVEYEEKDGKYIATIKIREGKYHQVKRMFGAVGNCVVHLHRSAIGALQIEPSLPEGACRKLSPEELDLLFTD